MPTARNVRIGIAASAVMMLFAGITTAASTAATTTPKPGVEPRTATTPKLKLLWREEYNGKKGLPWTVKTSTQNEKKHHNWATEVTGVPPNKERQFYTDGVVEYTSDGKILHRAIELDGYGNLAINARKVTPKYGKRPSNAPPDYCVYGQCEFVSGRMTTHGKLGFAYGQIDARIKIPRGEGTWPAFWMLGMKPDGQWPQCGEIDIMEASYSNRYGVTFSTLHSYPADGFGITAQTNPDDIYGQYNVYSVRWSFNKIAFLFNREVFFEITKPEVVAERVPVEGIGSVAREYPFNQEFFLILNVAMGGTLGGDFDGLVTDPNAKGGTMLVDYIRYYSVDGVGRLVRR